MTTSSRAAFFDEADVSLMIFNEDFICIDANPAATTMTKINREELVGCSIERISPDVFVNGRIEIYKEVLRTGKPFVFAQKKAHPSFGTIYIKLKVFKVAEGLGFMATDITESKVASDELETFIYKCSHNLRGPIASILGLTRIAMLESEKTKDCLDVFNMMKEKAEELDASLIILRESMKHRSVEKVNAPIDLDHILDNVVEITCPPESPTAQQIEFISDIQVNGEFWCDEALLTSIISNLVDNSIKYRRSNVNSFVKVSARDTNNGICLEVADNGIGISRNLQDNLFKMFFRATALAKGTGLGLYTVKQILTNLNGTVTLESDPATGTRVQVCIPSAQVSSNDANKVNVLRSSTR